MQGDFSRWTFDPRRDYRSVLMQQGRVLLDADFNEQAEVTRHHDEIRAHDIVGRAGGPADSVGFAITDNTGGVPADTGWADLRITPGRYYVDGILVEARAAHTDAGRIELIDQPYLAAVEGVPGLPEPGTDGRYVAYLDTWTQHVTADEDPSLREAALGGADTCTRARTVWQVRVTEIDGTTECSDLHAPGWLTATPGTMTPGLGEAPPDPDPCHISESGGYTRLENQLYRVQIHEAVGTPTYLWSRENGSVVAGLVGITPATGGISDLTLDRVGRDEELSIGEGDTVEVTSTDLQLRGEQGFLATAGAADALVLPVTWSAAWPTTLAALGRAPIVRRWEGAARPATTTPELLEDGITVSFDGGPYRTGDYWLIPARTVRLAYGIGTLAGTIDWPTDDAGAPLPARPLGPVHHVTPLAIFSRSAAGWTRLSDCRRIAPSLNQLIAIDLIGGDGQETDSGGVAIPEPIRVAVRNGGVAVVGAQVRFTVAAGTVTAAGATGAAVVASTGADGVASVQWNLDSQASSTQTLVAQRLNDRSEPVDVPVVATGRLGRGGGRPPGLHVVKAIFNVDGRQFANDDEIKSEDFAEGLTILLDGRVNPASVISPGRPVRVVFQLPFPIPQEMQPHWTNVPPFGFRPIELGADIRVNNEELAWKPSERTRTWLLNDLRPGMQVAHWAEPLLARFEIDGWAVVGEDAKLHLNGHARTVVDANGRTRVELPTDDEVTGGQFVQWFRVRVI